MFLRLSVVALIRQNNIERTNLKTKAVLVYKEVIVRTAVQHSTRC